MITGLFVISVITILLAALLAYLLARRIIRPVHDVMQAMERLAHNDMSVQLPEKRRDELGALTSFFNSMVVMLRETAERNEGIQRLKTEFIATAAHQLRTPLTGLRWALHYVSDKGESLPLPERQKALAEAAATTDKMMRMVNDLLNVSKVEEGKFGLDLRSVNITKMVQEILQESEIRATEANITLEFKSDVDSRLAIVADADHLRLLLSNLLDNALAYTRPRGRITVSLKLAGNFITIHVADTGIGIPAADQPKIFTQFHRADNAEKARTDGSGLGLFIARNIVRRHGGDITFTSQENVGTTFTVTLPLREELIPKAQNLEDVLSEI
jgi:signal transduction histidine kinase